jgi:hypothetical protein
VLKQSPNHIIAIANHIIAIANHIIAIANHIIVANQFLSKPALCLAHYGLYPTLH